jgi:RNA polymerase sigma-70 factor (ECF subfamily)
LYRAAAAACSPSRTEVWVQQDLRLIYRSPPAQDSFGEKRWWGSAAPDRHTGPHWEAIMQKAQGLPDVLQTYAKLSGPQLSDLVLLKRIAEGDKRDMEILFRRHNVAIYRFVMRLTGDASLAEDVVSEVFLDVWRHAQGFAGRCQVSTWLLAIARNKAISAIRTRSKAAPQDDFATIAPPGDNPEIALQEGDRSKVLKACLARLSPAHREVIDLVYYHEKSIEEVADILAAPANTVKTRMFHARRYLASFLKSAGIDDVHTC